MLKITKRSTAVLAAGVVAIGGCGAAWAAWSVSNHATATVSTGSATPVEISGAALTSPLVPGTATGVRFTVKNANNFNVVVTGGTLTDFHTTKTDCNANNFVFVPADFADVTVPPNNATQTVTWPSSIKLKSSPDPACQGASITFEVRVNAESKDVA